MWQTKGQDNALALIEKGIHTDNLSHAFLFVGPSHVGKTTLALDLARALNCSSDESPCGQCPSCLRITDNKHTDISIIALDQSLVKNKNETASQSEIGIKDIQELQKRASLPPFEGKHKVFIIKDAENLSIEAANCLLKILEEPPPKVLIILMASDDSKLLSTVVSRCQRIELKPLSSSSIEEILIRSFNMEIDRAKLLSRLSGGCLGYALISSTDFIQIEQRSQRLLDLFSLIKVNYNERFLDVSQFDHSKNNIDQLLKTWLTWWRDIFLIKSDCRQSITNIDFISEAEEWASAFEMSELVNAIQHLHKSLDQLAKNINSRLVMEILMLHMPVMRGKGNK